MSMFDDCGIGWEGGDAVDGLFPMMRVFQHDLDVVFRWVEGGAVFRIIVVWSSLRSSWTLWYLLSMTIRRG